MDNQDYECLKNDEPINCIYKDCSGKLRKVSEDRRLIKSGNKNYYENSFICRCTRNCRHKIVLIKNELSSKIVSLKF